jgi:phenylacetic acid degradation operon negative regulatory protein
MTPIRARSMLFTFFGDYAHPSGRDVPLGGLVEAGHALGISEAATRSAVARLAQARWIAARRAGKRSFYTLSAAGRRLIEEGTQRIYAPPTRWSGRWCLLQYSIPEDRRALRDGIRKQLAWLGFGPLGGGAYASPRDVASAARRLVAGSGLSRYARVFTASYDGPGDDADLVARCWDLRAIARRYAAFVEHYEPLFRRDVRRQRAGALDDVDAFATRFALTHDFRRFPFIDPGLPDALLPAHWVGHRALSLFRGHHALLADGAMRYFRRIVRSG